MVLAVTINFFIQLSRNATFVGSFALGPSMFPKFCFFMTLAVLLHSAGHASSEKTSSHDVIVVGAGAAGLYAAKTLQGFGYEVLIIEAKDRIGGRIKSETLGDMRVELGAEEHYLAEGGNPIWGAMIAEFGDEIYVQPHQGASAFSMDDGAGTCWATEFALNPCSNDSDVTAVDEFWNWYQLLEAHQDPSSTLADDVFNEYGVGPGHRAYHLYDAGIAGATFATNLDQLGARSLALESNEWDLSNTIRAIADKDLGYSDALELLWWDEVTSGSDILLSTPVQVIDTTGDHVLVLDANGGRHLAKQVIVTVSIGVLQSGVIEFNPELPASTIEAYMGIGFDSGMKIAIRFSSPWWETEGEPLAWLVTEGVAGVCWVPSDYKSNTASHILMCYPMGDNSRALRALASNGNSSAIVDAVLKDLDNTFPQAPNAASVNYIEALVEDWGADPYTRGAYSYPRVETVLSIELDNRRRDLKRPVAADRIFFAGEATHETHPASVVGAIHEGERAALQVNSVNGTPGQPPSLPLELPSAPAITSTDYGDGKIILAVSVSDNGGKEITGYEATCTDGTNTYTGTSTSSAITVSGLTNGVSYTCSVTATNSEGTSAASAATASIIPSPKPPRVVLEEPVMDETHTGVGNLRGWAISSDGIEKVEVHIDGSYAFDAPYGGVRTDVRDAFPDVKGSGNSGFSLAFNYSNLSSGTHTVSVIAHSGAGATKESAADFEVVRFDSSFISAPNAVDLSEGSCSLASDEVTLSNVTVDGSQHNLVMKWRRAEQGFELIQIDKSDDETAEAARIAFSAQQSHIVAQSDPILRVILEEPILEEIHTGVGNLRGWAIADEGIEKVEIYIDGAYSFDAPYGGVRTDVRDAFPDAEGSENSGFSLAFNYSNLSAGGHTIKAIAYDRLGATKESSAEFTVVRFDSSFISDLNAVDLSEGSCSLGTDDVSLTDVTVDGSLHDLVMKWRTAEQGFEIVEIP